MHWFLCRMESADIEPLMAIEAECFHAPWGRLSFEAEIAGRNAYGIVAKTRESGREPRIIGYICFRLVVGEIHLFRIAVAPRWRGRGVASQLLAECLHTARRHDAVAVLLEARPSNHEALALYRKFGFKVIAVRPNYYPDSREDALMLQKPLTGLTQSDTTKEDA